MGASDRIKQIIEWRTRRGRVGIEYLVPTLIGDFRSQWEANPVEEFCDFIPIRLVTFIEVFTREWVRAIVDHGQPYITRAEKLVKNEKIDFLFSMEIQNRRVSLGDLVAHAVSVSGVTQILSIFGTLIEDFVVKISAVHDRWEVEVEGKEKRPIISDLQGTLKTLDNLFSIRHILTHEYPRHKPFDIAQIGRFFDATSQLISAAEEIAELEIKGVTPLTQTDMNITSYANLQKLTKDLEDHINKVSSLSDINSELLAESQDAWEKFTEADARLYASLAAGGTMEPMLFADRKAELTSQRLEHLRWWLERESEF